MSFVRILGLITRLSGSLALCAVVVGGPAAADKVGSPDKGGLDRSCLDPSRISNYIGVVHEQNTNYEIGREFEVDEWAVLAVGSVGSVGSVGMVVNQHYTFHLNLEILFSSFSQLVDGRELALDYVCNFCRRRK